MDQYIVDQYFFYYLEHGWLYIIYVNKALFCKILFEKLQMEKRSCMFYLRSQGMWWGSQY